MEQIVLEEDDDLEIDDREYFLQKSDFHSPLLWKIYKFMKAITHGGRNVLTDRITNFLNEADLNIIVENVKRCASQFEEYYKSGTKYKGYETSFNGRLTPFYYGSTLQKHLNAVERMNLLKGVKPGEIKALEAVLYEFADNIIHIGDAEAFDLGRNVGDRHFNIRPKGEQLERINKLFCGIGDRIISRKKKLANVIEDNVSNYLTDKRSITVPSGLISSYISPETGGFKKTKSRRKRRKTRKNKKSLKRR